jgi:hypothetical protein
MIALLGLCLLAIPAGCSQKTEYIRIPPDPALTQSHKVPVLKPGATWGDLAESAKQCETELRKCNIDKAGLRGESVE